MATRLREDPRDGLLNSHGRTGYEQLFIDAFNRVNREFLYRGKIPFMVEFKPVSLYLQDIGRTFTPDFVIGAYTLRSPDGKELSIALEPHGAPIIDGNFIRKLKSAS